MGRKQATQLVPAGGEWERRKAEQAERITAAMEDPVSRYYLRHGRPACRQAPDADSAGAAEDADPDPA